MLYFIIRNLAKCLYKLLFRLQVSGQAHIPKQGGFILASNHASYLDPPALAAACPRIVSFLAKEGLFRNVFFGRFISSLNAFPIKTHSADFGALRLAIKELKAGKVLTIFPEGGRSLDGNLKLIEFNSPAPPAVLQPSLATRLLDQKPPHGLRCGGEKVSS